MMAAQAFTLDPRLAADCHILKRSQACEILLLDNRLFRPWFILVPHTTEIELMDLAPEQLYMVLHDIAAVSGFVRNTYAPDKINTATIGNIVKQLHIHVVARYHDDPAWPGTVWGYAEQRTPYPIAEVERIRMQLDSIEWS